jgi:hypothetical protein
MVIIKYSELFDDQPLEPKEYLIGISRNLLLTACSHFIALTEYQKMNGNYIEFICNFFSPKNVVFANTLIKRLDRIQNITQAKLTLVTIYGCLELFEYCFDNIPETDIQTELEAEINLFKVLLLFNERRTEREKVSSESTKDLNGKPRPVEFFFSHSCPTSDVENFYLYEVFFSQIIKAFMLFEFMGADPSLKPLLNSFLEHFNCIDSQQYLRRLLLIVLPIMGERKPGNMKLTLNDDEDYKENSDFLDKFILPNKEIADVDFRDLRSQPIHKINDHEYLITFDLFVMEMIFKGLFFRLKTFNDTLPKNIKKSNFRGYYTFEFSEKHLVYSIMHMLFGTKYKQLSGEEMAEDGAPDYYIRNGNNIFIFESKDILLDANIKSSYDYRLYEPELIKKLYEKTKDGKTSNTAIKQLIGSIKKVFKKELSDKGYKEKNIIIYPIIILHDQFWNIQGLNTILNRWFQVELQSLKIAGFHIEGIRPLVSITTDTFLMYQDLFRDRKIRLEQVLDAFYKDIESHSQKKTHSTTEEALSKFQKTIQPFSLFLRNYTNNKGYKNIQPRMLIEKSLLLLPK